MYPGTMSITSNNPLYSFNPSTYGIPNLKGAAHCYFVLRRIRFPQPPLLYISPLIVNETCMHNLIPSCNYTFACIVLKFRLLRRSCTLNGGGGGVPWFVRGRTPSEILGAGSFCPLYELLYGLLHPWLDEMNTYYNMSTECLLHCGIIEVTMSFHCGATWKHIHNFPIGIFNYGLLVGPKMPKFDEPEPTRN